MNNPAVIRLFVLSFFLSFVGAMVAVALNLHGWCVTFAATLVATALLMPENRYERA